MGAPPTVKVDVRDMLCAQALVVAARAMERLNVGEALEILYNTEDVRQDLLVWANDRDHIAHDDGTTALRVTRRY
jgi:TusA-related sulfurtransferase